MLLTFLAIPAILAITNHDDTAGLPDSLVNRRLNVNMELARVTTRRVQSFGADRLAGLQTITSIALLVFTKQIWEAYLGGTSTGRKFLFFIFYVTRVCINWITPGFVC
jgi:hypothetical protein